MSPSTLRIIIGIVLIAHGLVHFSLTTVPVPAPGKLRTPFWPSWWRKDVDPHWLASKMGLAPDAVRAVGSLLWVLTVIGFGIAGLALILFPAQAAVWQAAAILGASASLLLLVFYWHPWLPAGILIDLAVFASLALHWPPALYNLAN